MAIYKNITGELTQELLSESSEQSGSSISLCNVASNSCKVDLYIEKKLTGKFYIIKDLFLHVGQTLVHDVRREQGFGVYIKLTKSGAGVNPEVDIIIR
tara:strand:+ start:636 stop:929 length:294 start_codon:yes stop_codon:yes gene_type:complete